MTNTAHTPQSTYGTMTGSGRQFPLRDVVLGGQLTLHQQDPDNLLPIDTFELSRSELRRADEYPDTHPNHHYYEEFDDSVQPGNAGYDRFVDTSTPGPTAEALAENHVELTHDQRVAAELAQLRIHADRLDEFVVGLMGKMTIPVVRIGLAIIFFWFGALKFFDGMSPAQNLVEDTATELALLLGFSSAPSRVVLFLLAFWEVAIGIGLLTNRYPRTCLLMLFLQLPGTVLPIFLLPEVVWTSFPFGLTLEGQYIVKNLILVGAAFALGSQIRYEEQLARRQHTDDKPQPDAIPNNDDNFDDDNNNSASQDDQLWQAEQQSPDEHVHYAPAYIDHSDADRHSSDHMDQWGEPEIYESHEPEAPSLIDYFDDGHDLPSDATQQHAIIGKLPDATQTHKTIVERAEHPGRNIELANTKTFRSSFD